MKPTLSLASLLLVTVSAASAAPATYRIDPAHTFPSFEADHMGISVWRGKLNKTSGTVIFDKEAGTGTVELAIDLASIDFGHDQLNTWARGKDFFDTKKYPKAIYKGRFEGAGAGKTPAEVSGELTLHGVTKPVALKVHLFKCVPHPMFKRDVCGADATATFNRDEFGLGVGKEYGFKMDVDLRIQVEAIAEK